MIRILLPFLIIILIQTESLISKPYYSDGNYSEDGGAPHMCMRCHMGILNPEGTRMSLKASKLTAKPGDTISLTVTISNFKKEWNPGIGIFFDINSKYAVRTPGEYGWETISSPNNNRFSYIKSKPGDSVFVWKVRAPQIPGSYRIATSAYFADYSQTTPVMGTKRGDNSLVVEVSQGQNDTKPVLMSSYGRYKNFVFMTFSVPVDSASAVTVKNYYIKKDGASKPLEILDAFQSRDRKTIVLRTEDQEQNVDYSLEIFDLKDYSEKPNVIDAIKTNFRSDLASPYKIYAEWSQDVTAKEIKQLDMTEYTGSFSSETYRTNLCFALPDSPIDVLPVTDFKSARLYLCQKEIPRPSADPIKWNVYKLKPGTNWYDYAGNNQTVETNWSGYNQQEPPLASINMAPGSQADGSYWIWDITKDFSERFKNLGGNGTNINDYFLRIKAEDEAGLTGAAGFHGSDAEQRDQMPFIALEFDTTTTSVPNLNDNERSFIQVDPNPVSGTSTVRCHIEESGKARLSVFDMTGHEVLVMADGYLYRGNYDYSMEPGKNALPDGIYFIRLETRSGIFSEKAEISR